MIVTTKTCSRCHQAKPLDDFKTDQRKPDGKASACKACVAVPRVGKTVTEIYSLEAGHERLKDHPFAGLFPLLSETELNELAADIATNGQRDPVVIHKDMILDGRNRYRACRKRNLAVLCGQFTGTNDEALDYVISKNIFRRHLEASQRAHAMASYEQYRWGGPRQPQQQDANLHLDISAETPTPSTRADLAERGHVSARLIASAAVVRDHGTEQLNEAVRDGQIVASAAEEIARRPAEEQEAILAALPRDETGKLTPEAKKALSPIIKEIRAEKQIEKKERREAREQELGKSQHNLPDKKFGVILADPEWPFDVWSEETGQDRAAKNHYPTSTIEVISSRPVATIAADDCVLGLWATVPKLPAALDVMREWGFTYVTHIAWIKDRIGTGYWFRNNHEILLIGKRGAPPKPADGTQWCSSIAAPRGAHSEKPDFQYEFFETFFPTWPKIELNARRARPGWKPWGFEAPTSHQEIPEPAESLDPAQTTAGGVLIPSMAAEQAGEPDAGELPVAGASAAASPALLAPAEPGGCEGGCGHAPEVYLAPDEDAA